MTPIPTALQTPLILLLFCAVLCLIFETAGVKEGFRRYGNKNYISLVTGICILTVFLLVLSSPTNRISKVSGLVFDATSKNAILALSLLCMCSLWLLIERLKSENADRGELYAVLLASFFFSIIMCCTENWVVLVGSYFGMISTQISLLAMRKKRRTSPELALRWVITSAFLLMLFAVMLMFASLGLMPPTVVLMITLSLFIVGAFPLQAFQVDALDGSPSYCAAFLAGSNLINALAVLWRLSQASSQELFSSRIAFALIVLAALSSCILPIMALDQRRMSRLIAYLLTSQAGIVLVFASLLFGNIELPPYFFGLTLTHFALCAAGSFAGLNFWRNSRQTFRTWEDFAGAGRQHPFEAGAFFIVLAALCGLPFTSGFAIRKTLIDFSSPEYRVPVLALFWVSTVLGSVPMFRLFAFFFGKPVRHELRKNHKPTRVALLYLCAGILVLCALAPLSVLRFVFDFS